VKGITYFSKKKEGEDDPVVEKGKRRKVGFYAVGSAIDLYGEGERAVL